LFVCCCSAYSCISVVFIPALILILNFSPRDAAALSPTLIFGSQIYNFSTLLKKRHPDFPSKLLIDLDLVLQMLPMVRIRTRERERERKGGGGGEGGRDCLSLCIMCARVCVCVCVCVCVFVCMFVFAYHACEWQGLIGTSVGVVFNRISPSWVTFIFLVSVLSFTVWKATEKV
jgi:hypothetical protein